MNRKAIIVGAGNVPNENVLPGVAVDIRAYQSLLVDSIAGAWKESEISVLSNPDYATLLREIKAADSEGYLFLSFSGHGFMRDGANYIVLRDKSVRVAELNYASRQLMIIDSCRVIQKMDRAGMMATASLKKSAGMSLDFSRREFNRSLEAAEKGLSTVYSTSAGESASEDEL